SKSSPKGVTAYCLPHPHDGLGEREPGGTTGDWGSPRLWRPTSDSLQYPRCNQGLGLLGNAARTGDTKGVDSCVTAFLN
ncbi:MAG: hypothetical protein ACYTXE_45565, partial [Nostoc sp.]